ncbi:uncharacterized protein LOC134766051 [Penaeus indicus]|uniref:uncharacterized protein LOC134766051 n=1 Tax=Penaeus indicus TaxID=29960 RepID=UPI00300D19A4
MRKRGTHPWEMRVNNQPKILANSISIFLLLPSLPLPLPPPPPSLSPLPHATTVPEHWEQTEKIHLCVKAILNSPPPETHIELRHSQPDPDSVCLSVTVTQSVCQSYSYTKNPKLRAHNQCPEQPRHPNAQASFIVSHSSFHCSRDPRSTSPIFLASHSRQLPAKIWNTDTFVKVLHLTLSPRSEVHASEDILHRTTAAISCPHSINIQGRNKRDAVCSPGARATLVWHGSSAAAASLLSPGGVNLSGVVIPHPLAFIANKSSPNALPTRWQPARIPSQKFTDPPLPPPPSVGHCFPAPRSGFVFVATRWLQSISYHNQHRLYILRSCQGCSSVTGKYKGMFLFRSKQSSSSPHPTPTPIPHPSLATLPHSESSTITYPTSTTLAHPKQAHSYAPSPPQYQTLSTTTYSPPPHHRHTLANPLSNLPRPHSVAITTFPATCP